MIFITGLDSQVIRTYMIMIMIMIMYFLKIPGNIITATLPDINIIIIRKYFLRIIGEKSANISHIVC